MRPDLVMHSNDIAPPTVITQLQKVGINIKVFPGANTLDSAKLLLTILGKYFGEEKKADSLNKNLDAGMEKVYAAEKALKDTPSVMILQGTEVVEEGDRKR